MKLPPLNEGDDVLVRERWRGKVIAVDDPLGTVRVDLTEDGEEVLVYRPEVQLVDGVVSSDADE